MDSHDTTPVPEAQAEPAPVATGAASLEPGRRGGIGFGAILVLAVTFLSMAGVVGLLNRPNPDSGVRVWLLNHTPDQVIIINPFKGIVEKKFLVADGLKELAFSRDYGKAYIANVVDVSNRVTVLDTTTYLQSEEIEVDGVPQGIGVFPDDERIAVILGSKSDFMAGGFDVLDLTQQSKADPKKKKRLYRERELALTHKLAVSDDGKRIYCIDAKKSLINIYGYDERGKIGEVDLHGAPEYMLYPPGGKYYYVSVLQHYAIYQLDKKTDTITGAYIYGLPDPKKQFNVGKLRYMAVDSTGDFLFATCYEAKTVAVWQVGNPERIVDWRKEQFDPSYLMTAWYRSPEGGPLTHYLPMLRVRLKGGYDETLNFIPGGQQLALDPGDVNLFVVDEEGSLYTYDVKKLLRAEELSVPEPENIVPIAKLGAEVEVRDMKVSRPVVRRGSEAEEQ